MPLQCEKGGRTMNAFFAARQPDPWLKATAAAFDAASKGRGAAAGDGWVRAGTLAAGFQAGDPRIATTWHNVAVAMLRARRFEIAVQNFGKARVSWDEALKWIEAIDIPLAGRGSIFHFQLAAEHSDAFTRAHRQRLVGLYCGASAITNVLSRLARHGMQAEVLAGPESEADFRAIATAFGESCPEINLLQQVRDGRVLAADAGKPCLFERWKRDPFQPTEQLSDFFASIFLVAGLHAKHLSWKNCIRNLSPSDSAPAVSILDAGCGACNLEPERTKPPLKKPTRKRN